jgi:hypothetical protein
MTAYSKRMPRAAALAVRVLVPLYATLVRLESVLTIQRNLRKGLLPETKSKTEVSRTNVMLDTLWTSGMPCEIPIAVLSATLD